MSWGFTKQAHWVDTVLCLTTGDNMRWIVSLVVIAAVVGAVYYFGYLPKWW